MTHYFLRTPFLLIVFSVLLANAAFAQSWSKRLINGTQTPDIADFVMVDFDDDGDADAVTLSYHALRGKVLLFENINGTMWLRDTLLVLGEEYDELPHVGISNAYSFIDYQDVDADGVSDLSISIDDSLLLYRGMGNNNFYSPIKLPIFGNSVNPGVFEWVDFDGSGQKALTSFSYQAVHIQTYVGPGQYAAPINIQTNHPVSLGVLKTYQPQTGSGKGLFVQTHYGRADTVVWSPQQQQFIIGAAIDKASNIDTTNNLHSAITYLNTENQNEVLQITHKRRIDSVPCDTLQFRLYIGWLTGSPVLKHKWEIQCGKRSYAFNEDPLAIWDADGDGATEIYYKYQASGGELGIYYLDAQPGDTIGSTPTPIADGYLEHLQLANVDNNGQLDLVGSSISQLKMLQLGVSNLTLNSIMGLPEMYPRDVVAEDIDGDGIKDLVFADDELHQVVYQRQYGDGQLEAPVVLVEDVLEAQRVAFADYDNDGDKDLFIGGQNHFYFATRTGSGFGTAQLIDTTAYSITELLPANLDSDPEEEVVLVSKWTPLLGVIDAPNAGQPQFVNLLPTVANTIADAVLNDFDNDGQMDICFSYSSTFSGNPLFVLNNQGNLNFGVDSILVDTTFKGQIGAMDIADLDGDGDQDIVLGAYGDDSTGTSWVYTIMAFENTGNFNNFIQHELIAGDSSVRNLVVADLQNDGGQDLIFHVAFNDFSNIDYVNTAEHQGGFSYAAPERIAMHVHDDRLKAFDLEGDGDIDIFSLGRWINQAYLLQNQTIVNNIDEALSTVDGEQVRVYPNPFGGQFTVDMPAGARADYRLINLQGQTVKSGAVSHADNTVAVRDLPAGLYILQLEGDVNASVKLVRQ